MKKDVKIAITGIGPLTAGGSGREDVWKSILKRDTGLGRKEYEIDGEGVGKFFLHEVKNFNIADYGIDRRSLEEVRAWKEGDEIIDLDYFLAVIKMAIDDSGLKIDEKNGGATGMILAHENIGHDHLYLKVIDELSFAGADNSKRPGTKKEFLDIFYKKFHRTGYELQTFMPLRHAAKIFDVHGYSLMINNACASGLFALEAASDAIQSGKCRRMIVAAVDHCNIFKQLWFRDVNMAAKDGRIKPFAMDRDGFTLGEGGAAFVLEDMDEARARGAGVYAEYSGGSFALEGWKVTYPDVTNDIYRDMIKNAMDRAGVKPSDIDLFVPHGVGTGITDKYEAKAISSIFGKKSKKPMITALKPYTGHTLGSTALLEAAIMLIGLKEGKVPPTLNCEELDESLGIDVLRKPANADNVKIAMKTACGFAGYDAACVFRII